jgi:hypothetical protein
MLALVQQDMDVAEGSRTFEDFRFGLFTPRVGRHRLPFDVVQEI